MWWSAEIARTSPPRMAGERCLRSRRRGGARPVELSGQRPLSARASPAPPLPQLHWGRGEKSATVKLIRILIISASARVGHRGVAGQPVALAEQFIDFVNRPPAVARRTARPERRFEAGVWRRLLPHPPAGQAPGLARQVRKCGLKGLEPADNPRRADHAISGFGRAGAGLVAGRGGGQMVISSSSALNMWMRGPGRLGILRRGSTMRVRGSKSWKEGREVPPFLDFTAPARLGRDTAGVQPQGPVPQRQ